MQTVHVLGDDTAEFSGVLQFGDSVVRWIGFGFEHGKLAVRQEGPMQLAGSFVGKESLDETKSSIET